MKKFDETCDVAQKKISGQAKSRHTEGSIKLEKKIIFSHNELSEIYSTPVEIEREINIDFRSVSRAIYKDLDFYPMTKRKLQNVLIQTLNN